MLSIALSDAILQRMQYMASLLLMIVVRLFRCCK